ncbi:MAG: hypothetical protein PF450_05540, partial [Bacteroidales bacterium]|nr:hypothetical protein [Bacteroidales bacterium]
EIEELKSRIKKLEFRESAFNNNVGKLEITLPVEAKLATLQEMNVDSSINIAKALEANFNKNNEDAIRLLEGAINNPTGNYIGYIQSAENYIEALSTIEGESFYFQLIKNQIELNRTLSEDALSLTEYRGTLKLLTQRLYSILHPDMFSLTVGRRENVEIGPTSAIISLPSDINIEMNNTTRVLINRVIEGQELIGFKNNDDRENLIFKEQPPIQNVPLIDWVDDNSFFPLSFRADMGYSIVFFGKEGDVLYELVHAPETAFLLQTYHSPIWNAPGANRYSVAAERDGWSYEDGQVEVQARELRKLSAVKVVINKNSFHMDYSFPVFSDIKWKSILMHAYRSKYLKIDTDSDHESLPQVKDIVLTNSLFSMGNLENIPLITDRGSLSGISDICAVAYWNEDIDTLVTGEWSGVKNYTSKDISGNIKANSFHVFTVPSLMVNGDENFSLSIDSKKRIESFTTNMGSSWIVNKRSRSLEVFDNSVFVADYINGVGHVARLDTENGQVQWQRNGINIENISVGELGVLGTGNSIGDRWWRYTARLDLQTGQTIWEGGKGSRFSSMRNNGSLKDIPGGDFANGDGESFYITREGMIHKLAPMDGDVIWSRGGGGIELLSTGNWLIPFGSRQGYQSRNSRFNVLNSLTGEIEWTGNGLPLLHKGIVYSISYKNIIARKV